MSRNANSRFRKNKFQHNRPRAPKGPIKDYHNQNQLCEKEVGITQFISQIEGYSGVIKARFSDFQVNEIDLNNEIAKLTDTSIPKDFNKKDTPTENLDEITTSPLDQIPQDKWVALKETLKSADDTSVELDADNMTKEDRKLIHATLKAAFGKKLYAQTVSKGDKKVMVFKKSSGKSDRFTWPEDKGEYVHFLVYKESLDTLDVCLKIADCLKIAASNFTYAGVKDKRAKTTQWFCVKRVEPWKLIIKTKRLQSVRIGNIKFVEQPLKLGQLSGNRFRIALRNVTGNDALIGESLESLREKGFINYYGLQRFGNNKEVPTFAVGVQLLLGNWKEACGIILKPTASDDPTYSVCKAKKVFFETGDAVKALQQFDDGSRNTCIEYLLLKGLKKENSNDFVNALTNIPRNTRLLYIHSFQSLIWNLAASKRIEKFGFQVVEGDLVLLEESKEKNLELNDDETEKESKPLVKALSSEDCANYTIYDIVLPLPGYDVIYPENLKDFYKETLESHGLALEMEKQKVQTYSLSGTYRKLLGQVKDLSWKIMQYTDPNYNLIRSDLEELKKQSEPKSVTDGKYKALVLEFSLSSSSYATMVLREILKSDTSSSANSKLNNYHVEEKEKVPTKTYVAPEPEEFNDKVGLLSDEKKYEEFKNLIFNPNDENPLKRKHDGNDEADAQKVQKLEAA